MSGKRRRYTPEFRGQAARLVIETGRPVAHVVVEIGVGEQVRGRRVRLHRQAAAAGDTGAVLDADERAELEGLRRENAKLRLDHEFLKKIRRLLCLRAEPVEAYRVIDAEKASWYLADRNYSPRTVRACGLDLLALCRWLAEQGMGLDAVTTVVLLDFLRACREAKVPGRPSGNVVSMSGSR